MSSGHQGNTMASSIRFKIFATIFLVSIFRYVRVNGNANGILSDLFKQASMENGDLFLVLDDANGANSNRMLDSNLAERFEIKKKTSNPLSKLLQIIQLNKKNSAYKLLNKKPLDERPRNKNRKQRFRQWNKNIRFDNTYNRNRFNRFKLNRDISKELDENLKHNRERFVDGEIISNKKSFLRSPLFKSFLRYSSALRCAARDECVDECDDNFLGNKKDKCEDKCEDKFECTESVEEDPCDRGECEESNECDDQDNCNISTRGITLVTETPKCKRC